MHDPIGGFERIRDLYLTYLETAFRIRDEGVTAERRALLETPGQLCTEPLVEPVPRYASAGLALHDLVAEDAGGTHLPGFSPAERLAFAELALAGLFDSELADAGALTSRKAKFPLYEHQATMLTRGIQEGQPGVVTSGTGSGKTESFLLPVFARIAQEATTWPAPAFGYLKRPWWHDGAGKPYADWKNVPDRPGKKSPNATPFRLHRKGESLKRPAAVRALVLYPMNALVEDQLTRIRKALDSDDARAVMDEHFNGNRVFFGRYTSATPVTSYHVHPRPGKDEPERRTRKLKDLFEAMTSAEQTQLGARAHDFDAPSGSEMTRFLFPSTDGAELLSRWDIQQTPPDILITNTSMLNAMLVREVDAPIFEKTRAWIESDPDAYFYLVLDELHLQRGSAGTEVAYLLRVLLDRLGLTAPEHRHKLRVLASSASLPVDEPEKRECSLQYLYDAFGLHGTWRRAGASPPDSPQAWAEAVVAGSSVREQPRGSGALQTEPFVDLLGVYGSPNQTRLDHPDDHEPLWRAVAAELGIDADGPLSHLVADAVAEAGARVAAACWSDEDDRARATKVSDLAQWLFGGKDELALRAVRGLLVARGVGDGLGGWWPEHAKALEKRLEGVASFRVHTFFRAVEGLFAAADEAASVDERFRSLERQVGPLSIERGERFSKRSDETRGNRMLELLYCECCGELYYGGRRSGPTDAVELLPYEPDVANLPDAARQMLFEDLSYDDYAIFWPSSRKAAEKLDGEPESGEWTSATLDPATGVVRRTLSGGDGGVAGRLYTRGANYVDGGEHKRPNDAAGTAVPFACPYCGTNYGLRKPTMRLSPVRSFRAGFAKTTQILATELFDLLRLSRDDAKLISFSDSRQEAARAALDVESGHHTDLRRDLLVAALREAARSDAAVNPTELKRLMDEAVAASDYVRAGELQTQLKNAQNPSADDAVPIDRVVENNDRKDFQTTGATKRVPLRPFVAGFVRLGLHPADAAGTKTVDYAHGDKKRSFHWAELFTVDGKHVDWAEDPGRAHELDSARVSLVSEAQRVLSDALFSRNYFALEETGVGYPCVLGVAPPDRAQMDAFLRVFTDAYRLRDNPWAKDSDPPPKSWGAEGDVNVRNRVRRFAKSVWSEPQVASKIGEVLKRLATAGHPDGRIVTSKLGVRLVGENAPFWRCSNCGRVHLHQGTRRCTRCFVELPEVATGEARELRQRHYVAKRVDRTAPPFRLRCEELTGQTHDPADRQRRFRGVVLDAVASGSSVPSSVSETLRRRASVIDLLTVTTTMEVGVDVGSLQATVQANMPPQRFNYQQRVGRAGRRRQAFSTVLTVCRNRSHDLYYFRYPEAITGDAPPPPFLSKNLPDPALRFARKVWLWHAFDRLRQSCEAACEPYPGDALRPPDIHGEFVSTDDFFAPGSPWLDRLRGALQDSEPFKDRLLATLAANSPLGALSLTTDEMMTDLASVVDPSSPSQLEATAAGLGQTLAEAGLLPMLGMPTRVRNLYYAFERPEKSWEPTEWKTVDRDLDTAIFEFAPGSVLVNDKRQLECVGFTGPLPEKTVKDDDGKWVFRPRMSALSDPFWLVACEHCSGWQRLDVRPDPNEPPTCQTCDTPLDVVASAEYRVPNGFRTDLRPRPFDPEARTPRRGGFGIVAEGYPVAFDLTAPANLACAYRQRTRTYRVNGGQDDGFSVTQCRDWKNGPYRTAIEAQVIAGSSNELRRNGYDVEPGGLAVEALHLAAPKTTDALFLAPQATHPQLDLLPRKADGTKNTAVRAAALSASFLLTYRAARELDVDPDELEVVEPRVVRLGDDGRRVPALQITDQLVNGAGYCRQLSELEHGVPRVVRLAESILQDREQSPLVEFLAPGHPKACDQSCYRCLQRYGNQAYHGLLDWRLGFAYLHALVDPAYKCGFDGFRDDPAGADWLDLAHRYATDLVRFDGVGSVRTFGRLVAFQLKPGGKWALVVHPLWSEANSPPAVLAALNEIEDQGLTWRLVNTFDLARNALAVRESLK